MSKSGYFKIWISDSFFGFRSEIQISNKFFWISDPKFFLDPEIGSKIQNFGSENRISDPKFRYRIWIPISDPRSNIRISDPRSGYFTIQIRILFSDPKLSGSA